MPILIYSVSVTSDPFTGFTGDDFTGTNGEPPNATYWTAQVNGATTAPEIQNNKLRCATNGSTTTYTAVISKFSISGDFDVRATLDDVSGYPSPLGGESGIMVKNINDTSDNFRIFCDSVSGGSMWVVTRLNGSNVDVKSGGVANDRKVRFRLTRTGTVVSAWYDVNQGDSYTLHTSYNWGISDPVDFRMYISTYSANPSLTLDFDDFNIEAGTVAEL